MKSHSTRLGPFVKDVKFPWENKDPRINRVVAGGVNQPQKPYHYVSQNLAADLLCDIKIRSAVMTLEQQKNNPNKTVLPQPLHRIVGFNIPSSNGK